MPNPNKIAIKINRLLIKNPYINRGFDTFGYRLIFEYRLVFNLRRQRPGTNLTDRWQAKGSPSPTCSNKVFFQWNVHS